jgi:hypothetical protein
VRPRSRRNPILRGPSGWELLSSLQDSDRFPASPSTPPSAACWAKLFRAYGAGLSPGTFQWRISRLVPHTRCENLVLPLQPAQLSCARDFASPVETSAPNNAKLYAYAHCYVRQPHIHALSVRGWRQPTKLALLLLPLADSLLASTESNRISTASSQTFGRSL